MIGKWHCVICGEPTTKPVEAVWFHLRPIGTPSLWGGCVTGTYKTFGFVAALCLVSPLANTIVNWRNRKARLAL